MDMSIPTRAERVTFIHPLALTPLDQTLSCSGKRAKLDIPTENGPQKKSLPLRMAFFIMVQNSELSVTKWAHGRYQRPSDFTVTGKSMSEIWTAVLSCSRLMLAPG